MSSDVGLGSIPDPRKQSVESNLCKQTILCIELQLKRKQCLCMH